MKLGFGWVDLLVQEVGQLGLQRLRPFAVLEIHAALP
jgi:hypothetical protein